MTLALTAAAWLSVSIPTALFVGKAIKGPF